MKNQCLQNLRSHSSIALALALIVACPIFAQSAAPKSERAMKDGKMMMKDGKTTMEGCDEMMAEKQKMAKEMTSQNADLTEQVAKMNLAPENKKVGMMAGIVTRMAEQRTARDAQHAKMEAGMMEHMMGHMAMGKESMSECPMMKGMGDMKGMDGKSGAHKEYHQEKN